MDTVGIQYKGAVERVGSEVGETNNNMAYLSKCLCLYGASLVVVAEGMMMVF